MKKKSMKHEHNSLILRGPPYGNGFMFCYYVLLRWLQVSPRPRERPVIHTAAVWFGPGRAVWVSHPGQVGDRAGQLCGSMRAGQCGRAGQGSWRVIIAGARAEIRDPSGGEKKGETIAVNMEFEYQSQRDV